MAVQERRHEALMPGGFARRLAQARFVLLGGPFGFALLVQCAGVAAMPALIGLAAIALAVLVREAALPGADGTSLYGDSTVPAVADRAVEAGISGLPGPALAL